MKLGHFAVVEELAGLFIYTRVWEAAAAILGILEFAEGVLHGCYRAVGRMTVQ